MKLYIQRFRIGGLFCIVILGFGAPGFAAPGPDSPADPRPRIRDLGIAPGILPPGPLNAITDVEGVRVGHRTLVRGDDVRTGVTAVLPHGGDLFADKVPAAVHVANGFGKAAGFLQVRELGEIETPIVLTNTLSVGTAVQATVAWTLRQPGHEEVRSVNAVVGETNDGYLNDIRGFHVRPADVWAAIDGAGGGAVAEGSVGAGTGTRLFGWKGGIGTASRELPAGLGGFTVGALVQTNFGGILTVDGVAVGELLGQYAFKDRLGAAPPGDASAPGDGSCMIVLATDAPLSPRNLERLARRAELGLARTGSFVSNGTGDFVIAFSTAHLIRDGDTPTRAAGEELRNRAMSPLFLAAVEAVEEAVYNSLTAATSMSGRDGHTVEAIPIDLLVGILAASSDGNPRASASPSRSARELTASRSSTTRTRTTPSSPARGRERPASGNSRGPGPSPGTASFPPERRPAVPAGSCHPLLRAE